jgi:hypothetical protein
VTLALGAMLLSLWDGLGFLREPPLFLAGMQGATALVVVGVCLHRAWTAAERAEVERVVAPAEPYLQRLFGLRTQAGHRPIGGRPSAQATGPVDFELGRTLYRWNDHDVRWARQKSLDRPVLVWSIPKGALGHSAPPTTQRSRLTSPGVVVRHPYVLVLHAVASGPNGGFLVTEPAAASPLAEVVQQRGLVPQEAAVLTARVARAVQAFHDQGACHGRLDPEWILARGELEPVLCPCGFPSQSADDRLRDVQALGRMLQQWLPRRSGRRGRLVLASLYRTADGAAAGAYTRPADLAADLERAARHMRTLWRWQWAHLLVLVLLAAGAALFPFAVPALGAPVEADGQDSITRARMLEEWTGYLFLALAPGIAVLSYIQGRALMRWAAERRHPGRVRLLGAGAAAGYDLLLGLLLLAALSAPGLTRLASGNGGSGTAGSLLLLAGAYAALWLLGVCVALLVHFVELLFGSLQPTPVPGEQR